MQMHHCVILLLRVAEHVEILLRPLKKGLVNVFTIAGSVQREDYLSAIDAIKEWLPHFLLLLCLYLTHYDKKQQSSLSKSTVGLHTRIDRMQAEGDNGSSPGTTNAAGARMNVRNKHHDDESLSFDVSMEPDARRRSSETRSTVIDPSRDPLSQREFRNEHKTAGLLNAKLTSLLWNPRSQYTEQHGSLLIPVSYPCVVCEDGLVHKPRFTVYPASLDGTCEQGAGSQVSALSQQVLALREDLQHIRSAIHRVFGEEVEAQEEDESQEEDEDQEEGAATCKLHPKALGEGHRNQADDTQDAGRLTITERPNATLKRRHDIALCL